MEKLTNLIKEKYSKLLTNMMYELAKNSIGNEEITINTSVGNITIKLNK